MKLNRWVLSWFFVGMIIALSTSVLAYSTGNLNPSDPQQARSTLVLKKYMGQFGSLVAGMEILRLKEKQPDWEAIQLTLTEMNKTLQELKAADQQGNYKEFTQVLEKNLVEVQAYGKSKNPKIFNSFEKLTQTCFQCHAAHRPSDFWVPKEGDPKISKQSTSFLWTPQAAGLER